MSVHTPRRALIRPRPSVNNASLRTDATPDFTSSYAGVPPSASALAGLTAREVLARKASLNQLTSNSRTEVPDDIIDYSNNTLDECVSSQSSPPVMAPSTPGQRDGGGNNDEIEMGDLVDVPGGMHGTVKFLGSVKGKRGVFAGVELSREFAPRGKNDGDVEGTKYFLTSIKNAGIFLPISRARKRISPTASSGSFPPTPTTPSLGGYHLGGASTESSARPAHTPPTPSVPKFSQSVGPGRAPSPQFKARSRPSLPRPESPLRRTQPLLSTPGRPSIGGSRYVASPTPGKLGSSIAGGRRISSSSSYAGDPGKKTSSISTRPTASRGALGGPRAGSALGRRPNIFTDHNNESEMAIGVAQTVDSRGSSISGPTGRAGPASDALDEEIKRLRAQIDDRDQQLKEQASSLAEMEDGFAELQSLLPANGASDGGGMRSGGKRGSDADEHDTQHLRSLLREKNEKIALLTAEFDAHRADFRSTIDTLEMASTETERVYEKRVDDLQNEIRELQDRSEDVESVARQLKQLEELVQELEEGLEDARRGEAEARGEVEFLRGEVERGRSELRREREKAATVTKGSNAAIGGGPAAKEVEQRDDEIRGLKAIIHSLSRDAVPDGSAPTRDGNATPSSARARGSFPRPTAASAQRTSLQLTEERLAKESLQREVKELQGRIERKTLRETQLERELELWKHSSASAPTSDTQRGSAHAIDSTGPSERTLTPSARGSGGNGSSHQRGPTSGAATERDSGARTVGPTATSHARERPRKESVSDLFCEVCDKQGHDIMNCTNIFAVQRSGPTSARAPLTSGADRGADRGAEPSTTGAQKTGKDAVIRGLHNLSVDSIHSEHLIRPASPGWKDPTHVPASVPSASTLPNPNDNGMVAGKTSGVIDPAKWCALCERDGHESVDCPFEDAF